MVNIDALREKMEEVNKRCENIERNLTLLEKIPHLKSFIDNLGQGINITFLSFQRLNENAERRQFLIDLQCNKAIFSGPIHEEYHSVIADLNLDFDIFFSTIKTCLNRLPNLICEILDHEEKKELRSKSYGSFILSLKNKEFTRNSLINLKNILLKYEPEIEVIINYRDKKIEHIHRPKEYSTFSDENGIARYYGKEMHVEIPRKEMDMEDYKRKIDLLPKNKQGVALKVGLQNSKEYIYYVHLISDKKTGDALDKGDRVGLISDGGSGHFDKYGSHGHTFTSPNLSVDKVFGFDDQTSPGTYKSLNILVEFLDQVINAVAKIVSQKNNEN